MDSAGRLPVGLRLFVARDPGEACSNVTWSSSAIARGWRQALFWPFGRGSQMDRISFHRRMMARAIALSKVSGAEMLWGDPCAEIFSTGSAAA